MELKKTFPLTRFLSCQCFAGGAHVFCCPIPSNSDLIACNKEFHLVRLPAYSIKTPIVMILEPGEIIRPIINKEEVKQLVEELYGIQVLQIIELNGYDDKNYRIIETSCERNELAENDSGYVFKIMNSKDTQNLCVIEAQNKVMNFLSNSSITCPKPIRNISGEFYSVQNISGKNHAVRLLEYVPGKLLKDVPPVSDALMYQLGEYVAKLDNMLQNFSHPGLVSREHIWMLSAVPKLENFIYVIKDLEKAELAKQVVEEYNTVVVPLLSDLEKGFIHGDVNEMNIIVGLKPGSDTEYQIRGIIDFGDFQYSYYVFELAVTMTYAILLTGELYVGGVVLAGYTAHRRVLDKEYHLLKLLISSRLVQSLVLGAYSKQQDPSNVDYVTTTEKANGWDVLRKIRNATSEESGATDWKNIAHRYLNKQ